MVQACGYNCTKLLTLYHTIQTFNDPVKEAFQKNCGKEHFLLFPPRSGGEPVGLMSWWLRV